ncbi:MAG: hypothetical protein Q4D81_07135 [Eubacteriales bacterium]|jgi:hypothetical protein|nr:hypothetical protein [Eubacteriales bacterium]
MKRFISILIALLLAVLPALAQEEQFSAFDHVILHTINGKYVVYEFPDITLYLPSEWEDAITVEQKENGIAFYQTASLEKWAEKGFPNGGFFFELCASKDEDFRDLPAYKDLGFCDHVGLFFYLVVPSDYPAYMEDEAIRAEYDEMSGRIDEVAEMARFAPSLHFYTDDIVETDAGMS